MRKTTTWALVVGCAAAAGAGAARAQDAVQPSTTRGSIVLPVGDKVHGFLRGGETHALQVHLAKGDVYSFSVNSQKNGDHLLMHLTLKDPRGNEINGDARVLHRASGKKITVGPWRVPKSGTYVIELYAETWFGGDYWGASKIRAPRRSVVTLPTDGKSVDVNVAAGSTLRLRANGTIAKFSMTTPGGEPSYVAGTDPLVSSLRARGLASAETGVYQFGVRGDATLDVTRPRWRVKTLNVPTLPDDPTRLAQFDFVLGWNPQQVPVTPDPAFVGTSTPSTPIGAPVPVGVTGGSTSTGPGSSNTTASLFIGGAVTAATTFIDHAPMDDGGSSTPADPGTPPPVTTPPVVTPPVITPPVTTPPVTTPPSAYPPRPINLFSQPSALHVTDFGIPTTVFSRPSAPFFGCAESIGRSAFFGTNTALRLTSWNQVLSAGRAMQGVHYPDVVASALLPLYFGAGQSLTNPISSEHGDDADPYFAQTFQFAVGGAKPLDGTVVTTTRYYVDGHQVPSLLATGGDTSITWTVEGSGNVNGTPWSLSGSWKTLMHPVSDGTARNLNFGMTNGITSCVISGEERYVAGGVEETIAMPEISLVPQVFSFSGYYSGTWYYYDPIGVVRNTLEAKDIGLSQTLERSFPPATLFPDIIDRYKHVDVKTTTIDPTTPVEGVEDDEAFDWILC
jgi:hypothetical protein